MDECKPLAVGGIAHEAAKWLRQGKNVGKLLPRGAATAPQYRAANQREVDVVTAEMTSDSFAAAIAMGGAVKVGWCTLTLSSPR